MDVFDLVATIRLNLSEFEQGLGQAKSKAESFAKSVSGLSSNISNIYSGVGDLFSPAVDGFKTVEGVGSKAAGAITTGFKALGGAATVAAGGAVAVGKSAFDAYASYEQLVGGVDKLYGEASNKLQIYAMNAYKTAGMSANQYMEQATSFSASLVSSLGGDVQQAADLTDVAMRSMSDNVNVFGSNMEDVQHAFQGFAKQNYTMLDNLKLGYGGTKEEMTRLIKDAAELTDVQKKLGLTVDANSMSFDNIVKAIQVVQTEMNIAGTTSREAASTIEGSVASMKAAWGNFMVGIATPDYIDDYEALTNDLVETVVTAGNNIVPRIQEIVKRGLDLLPYLAKGFSKIIPEFAKMGGEIVQTLADGLSKQVPALLDFGSKAIGWVAEGISENVPKAAFAVSSLITGIGDMIGKNSEALANAGWDIIIGIFQVFTSAGDLISQYIGDFVPMLADAFMSKHEALFTLGLDILGSIGQGIVENKEEIQEMAAITIENMVNSLRDNAPMIIEGGIALLEALAGAIIENLPLIIETGAEIIGSLVSGIATASPAVQAIIGVAVLPHILKIVDTIGEIGGAINSVMSIAQSFGGVISSLANPITIVIAAVAALAAGIIYLWNTNEDFRNAVGAIWEAIKGFFVGAWEAIKAAWSSAGEFFGGIVNAIKGAFDGIGEFLGGLFATAWKLVQSAWSAAVEFFTGIGDGIRSVFETVTSFLGEAFSAAWSAITAVWGAAVGFFSTIWNGISSAANTAATAVGGAFQKAWSSVTSVWNGAVSFFGGIASSIVGVFSDIGGKFLSIGSNIVDGLKSGISNAWNSFIGWIGNKVNGIVDAVKGMLGIHSPSTVFAGIGENMALGLAEGWDDEYNDIKRQITNGLNFGTASIGLSTNGTYNTTRTAQDGRQARFDGTGNTYVTINSPVAVDAVQAAREWKKTTQRMAMGYV